MLHVTNATYAICNVSNRLVSASPAPPPPCAGWPRPSGSVSARPTWPLTMCPWAAPRACWQQARQPACGRVGVMAGATSGRAGAVFFRARLSECRPLCAHCDRPECAQKPCCPQPLPCPAVCCAVLQMWVDLALQRRERAARAVMQRGGWRSTCASSSVWLGIPGACMTTHMPKCAPHSELAGVRVASVSLRTCTT